MRLSELSRRSDTSIATIKYYLREGLLEPGARLTARQADYDDGHVRRLRLIRAMMQVGGMSISQVRDALAIAADPDWDRHHRIGITQYMLPPRVEPPVDDPLWRAVRAEIAALMDELGWQVNEFAPPLDVLTRAVVALRSLGYHSEMDIIKQYANAVHPIAEAEFSVIEDYDELEEAMAATVVYTMLYEPVLLSLRRLAHEDVSAQLDNPGSIRSAKSRPDDDAVSDSGAE